MSENILEFRGLRKSYGEREILRGIDLTVRQGEAVCVIGPSGSGKSTLLRCVNLLETPSSGDILFHGKSILSRIDESDYCRRVGMVFQNFNLFSNMTVLDNCMLGQIRVQKKKKEEARATALRYLEAVGMAGFADRRPDRLSGGQKQRVAIARALCMDPEVLLFDEPTSALDPEMVGEVLAVIRDLASQGITMMIVTHEMNFAYEVASRVLFLDEGVVRLDGPPEEVMKDPSDERLRRFLAGFDYRT